MKFIDRMIDVFLSTTTFSLKGIAGGMLMSFFAFVVLFVIAFFAVMILSGRGADMVDVFASIIMLIVWGVFATISLLVHFRCKEIIKERAGKNPV